MKSEAVPSISDANPFHWGGVSKLNSQFGCGIRFAKAVFKL